MAGPRYLWGDSKVDFITFKARSIQPPGKVGRMYYDSTLGFRFCIDGTSFLEISDVLHN